MISCSSGTSGLPKGILSIHTTLLNQLSLPEIFENSVLFVFSTLYWVSGMWYLIESLKKCLKRVITNRPYTPEYFMEIIEKYQITHSLINPHQLTQFVEVIGKSSRSRLSSLYILFCGGSMVPETAMKKFHEIMGDAPRPGLVVGYAMTESACTLAMNYNGPGKRKILNGGRLGRNVRMRIVGKNYENLGIGKKGIIYFKLPQEWPGYLKNSKATEETLVNGWIKTGDVGFFDTDGYLTVCARDSEVFKAGKCLLQIFPPDIEKVIMELEGVLEVCVFPIPDDMEVNLIAGAVVVTNDQKGKNLTKSCIDLHVKNRMTKSLHLTGGIYFVESLPHTGSGKILRRNVPELILKKSYII